MKTSSINPYSYGVLPPLVFPLDDWEPGKLPKGKTGHQLCPACGEEVSDDWGKFSHGLEFKDSYVRIGRLPSIWRQFDDKVHERCLHLLTDKWSA